jgi:hypothetical protein
MLVKPFWLRFLYTWDKDFLRDRAWPVLREGARFYASYLHRSDDGLYHVVPTVSPEHRGITRNLEFNKDSQSSITLIRYHLNAAAEAARLLNESAGEAATWREIADHLPPYPTVDTPAGPIFIDVAGAEPIEYNIPVPLSAVFWGDDIGLDSSSDAIDLAKRTLEKINVWEPHRGYLKRVRTRLGIHRSEDGLNVESFLQSHTGRIRVFPAVPEGFAGGFDNLGAQGAFIVSARRNTSGVEHFEIESLAGNDCLLVNPWPGFPVGVVDTRTSLDVSRVQAADSVRFPTVKGGKYRLGPRPIL